MGAAFTISPQTIHYLSRPRSTSPSLLQQAALSANRIAYAVETGWADLPPDAQEGLRGLASELIEPSRGPRGVVRGLLGRLILAIVALRGDTDALYEYLAAVRRLVNSVLGAVEREHPKYSTLLAATVGDALTEGRALPLVPEEIRGWLDSMSDQAHREL